MTSALSMANQGHEVHLVEKENDLGGMARRLQLPPWTAWTCRSTWGGSWRARYTGTRLIHVYTNAEITEATGYVGNFVTTVKLRPGASAEIKHGATVIATGADVYKPTEYLYGQDERVLTHLELEERIARATSGYRERPDPGDDPVRGLPATPTATTARGSAAASPSRTP